MGFDLNAIEDQEPDAALGNGGLGRLAACFLDSLATLGYPAYGCGIRYRYGMFKQKIEDGYQVEVPDNWLENGNPFEIRRPEYAVEVKFGGYVRIEDRNGMSHFVQEGYQSVKAVPYDLPVVGYGNHIVNTLRIWDAEPVNTFNLDSFDRGDYQKAVEQENLAKNIVEVLYPNDNHYAGKELRLKQQYFFISASVQRAVQKFKEKHDDIHQFPEKVFIHRGLAPHFHQCKLCWVPDSLSVHNGGIIGQYGVIEQVTVELVAQVQTVDGNGLVINIDILYRHLVLG